MRIHNPFGRLSKSEGTRKLEEWSKAYSSKFNGNVYHYTSAAAFSSILHAKKLYCTDYRQLNDTTELTQGLEVIEASIAAWGEKIGISKDDVDDALDHLANLRIARNHISMFAASFSFHRNDLTQWRAYAPVHGVSIGFRMDALQRLAEAQGFVCGPVRYLGARFFETWLRQQLLSHKDGLAETAVNEERLRERMSGQPEEIVELSISSQKSANLERWLGEVSGLLKHPDFRSEAEWRCVFLFRENSLQRRTPVHFRQAREKLVRYLELDFSGADLNELITEVVIGPGSEKQETYNAVIELGRSAGLACEYWLPPHPVR